MAAVEFLFRMLFIFFFSLVLLIRFYFGFRLRKEGKSSWKVDNEAVEREGPGIIMLRLAGFLLLMGFFLLYLVNPGWFRFLHLPFPAWVRIIGILLALPSIALLYWTHSTLGKYWSTNLTVQEKHHLVTEGPYNYIRHPMYTALVGYFFGAGLLAANILLLIIFVGGAVFLFTRIAKEELMMVEAFGEEYLEYQKHTGQLLPKLRR